MKRLLTAALLCAVGLSLAIPATALSLKTDNLIFRTNRLAYAAPGYRDSIAACRVGTQIAVLDTTAGISTKNWARIPVSGAALDTMNFYCSVDVTDLTGSSTQASMDSLYLAAQGSADGVTWVTLGTFKGGTPGSITDRQAQTNVAGNFYTLGTKSSTAFPAFQHTYKLGVLTANQTCDVFSIHRWPMLRFIIGFCEAGGYKVRGFVSHYETP